MEDKKVVSEIFEKIVILKQSITYLKKAIPDWLKNTSGIHNSPKEYYSYWVLEDIEWTINFIFMVLEKYVQAIPKIEEQGYVYYYHLDYQDLIVLDTWQRKMYEYFLKNYFFNKNNNKCIVELFLLYSLLDLENSEMLDWIELYEVEKEFYNTPFRKEIVKAIISTTRALKNKNDIWFLENHVKETDIMSVKKNIKYIKSHSRLIRDMRNEINLDIKMKYFLCLRNYYWILSNSIHWNPIFRKKTSHLGWKLNEINEIIVHLLKENIIFLSNILWTKYFSWLDNIVLIEENALKKIKTQIGKEFKIWDRVDNWFRSTEWIILDKMETKFWAINYLVQSKDWEKLFHPSLFLEKIEIDTIKTFKSTAPY
jgi:hypothetical protein